MCFHSAINIFIRHCLSAISSEGLNLVALMKVCRLSEFFLFGMFELELDVVEEVDVECFQCSIEHGGGFLTVLMFIW